MCFGYPSGYKGYKLLDLKSNKVNISQNVTFHEDIFPFAKTTTDTHDHIFSVVPETKNITEHTYASSLSPEVIPDSLTENVEQLVADGSSNSDKAE